MTEEDAIQLKNQRALVRGNLIHNLIIDRNITNIEYQDKLKNEIKVTLINLKNYIQYGLPQTEEVKEIVNRINQLEIK